MTAAPRQQPPLPIQRRLRQEAGFGCCVCGHPIFEYHHIVPWAAEQHFRPEDMMILCPNHHGEANAQVISEAEQRQFKANAFNIQHGAASGQLTVDQAEPRIHIADSIAMVGAGPLIRIDGQDLLTIRTGDPELNLLLSATLFGEDDVLLAEIVDNQWRSGDSLPWDLDFKYRYLAVRNQPRDIALEIDARVEPLVLRATLWRRGERIRLGAAGIELPGNSGIRDLTLEGFTVSFDTSTGMTTLGPQTGGRSRRYAKPRRNAPCWCGSGKKFKKCHGA